MISSGNPGQIKEAQTRMSDALLGLGLVLGSYLLLTIINPGLTTLEQPSLGEAPSTEFSASQSGPQAKIEALKQAIQERFGIEMSGFDETHLLWAKRTFDRIYHTRFFEYVRGTVITAQAGGNYSSFQGCRKISLDQYNGEDLFSVVLVHELAHVMRSCNSKEQIRWDDHVKTIETDGEYVTGYAKTVCKDEQEADDRKKDEDYAEMIAYYLHPGVPEITMEKGLYRDCGNIGGIPYANGRIPAHLEIARGLLGEYLAPNTSPFTPVAPTIGIKTDKPQVVVGEIVSLSWNATGVSSCTASTGGNKQDAWQGEQKPAGSISFQAKGSGLTVFHLVCFIERKAGDTLSDSASLAVTTAASSDQTVPVVDTKIRVLYDRFAKAPSEGLLCNEYTDSPLETPCRISAGQQFAFTWESTPANTICTGGGTIPFQGVSSGNEGPVQFLGTSNETRRYTVTCMNQSNGMTDSDSVYLREDSTSPRVPFFEKPEWVFQEGDIKTERVGTTVGLRVRTRFDPGTRIEFAISESDWSIFDPDERIIPRKNVPALTGTVDSQGVAEAVWTITEDDLRAAGDRYDFSFYFTTSYQDIGSALASDYLPVP
ncbi:MAG: hypothetical protein HYU05_00450, partial [Candidatus Wildermuthbacteria bacterium]|nr:hypothetical protein [Candidatus Wildermuthbacteria bacterium]